MISLVVNLAKGERVQAAMIGRDSILGGFAAFGDQIALDSAVVLIPGTASTLDLDRLRAAAEQSSTMRSLLIRHGLAIHAQILHTAGCNAVHTVELRLARCLSQTHDLSGDVRLDLTQEALAQMIGARRNSVSLVASTLQQSNFIRYSRGRIDITNLEGLRTTACECYPAVKAQYERLLRSASALMTRCLQIAEAWGTVFGPTPICGSLGRISHSGMCLPRRGGGRTTTAPPQLQSLPEGN